MRLNIFPMSCTVFIATLIIFGCGVKDEVITINYIPDPNTQMVSGADSVAVRVSVADERRIKENVGKKGDEYSFLGAIIVQNDISDTLAKALESELQTLGFKLAEGDVEVSVGIIRFYSVFRGFNEKAIAELIMNTRVNNDSGDIIFAETVTGEGIKPSGAMRTGEDAKVALEAAMKDAVSKLFADTNFISALFKAAQ